MYIHYVYCKWYGGEDKYTKPHPCIFFTVQNDVEVGVDLIMTILVLLKLVFSVALCLTYIVSIAAKRTS